MFLLRTPTADDIHHYLRRQEQLDFSYAPVGQTAEAQSPAGYYHDAAEIVLGQGADTYRAACGALRQWRMFPTQLAALFWPSAPLCAGTAVVAGFRCGPVWSLNPCRIVYTLDETYASPEGHGQRFGFAYGTLPGHIAAGEERFLVDWDQTTNRVTYSVNCYSRPAGSVGRLGLPFLRYQQARFRRLSLQAMLVASRPAWPSRGDLRLAS